MEYKNLKTGAVINIDSKLNGGDWIRIKNKSKTSPKKKDETKKKNN